MLFGEDGFHGFFGGGVMWLLWIVLIVVLIYVMKDIGGNSKPSSSDDDALEIIKRRYARGEIDDVEYQRRKKELEK